MENFSQWLLQRLAERGWKQADLARASNLDSAVISNIVNGRRKAGEETCLAISKALKIPPETVFRAADLLPPLKEADPLTKEAEFILSHLSQKRRQQAIEYIKYLAQLQDQEEEERSNVVRKQGMGKTQPQKP